MIPGSGGRYALVVATARYDDPKLRQLRAPATDADRLAAVLADPQKGAFEVEVLIDEEQGRVARRIAGFFRDRRPDDLLLLQFSCHGIKDERGELFLAAADTEVDLLSATGISAAWLNDQITHTRSRRTVVLLDCCFSGSFPFGMRPRAAATVDAPEQLQGRGRAIITASSAMEYAYEGDELTGHGEPSVFTAAVVEGLESGRADLDHDQLISVDDLYGYVYDRVTELAPSQTPNKKSDLEGPLYLAASSYVPEVPPATLDPELLARTEDRYAGIREGAVQELAELARSKDPSVALAARQALTPLLQDDSRRVVARAQAALEESEPDPPSPPPPPPRPEPPAVASPPPRRESPGPRDRRRRWIAAAIAVGVLVIAGVVAIVAGGGGSGAGSSASGQNPGDVTSWTPDGCNAVAAPQTARTLGAIEAVTCDLPVTQFANDVHGAALTFARFATAGEARAALQATHDALVADQGNQDCDAATNQRLSSAYHAGRASCLVNPATGQFWLGANDDNSEVTGFATFDTPTTGATAVDAFASFIG
jgi:hypothetical protein